MLHHIQRSKKVDTVECHSGSLCTQKQNWLCHGQGCIQDASEEGSLHSVEGISDMPTYAFLSAGCHLCDIAQQKQALLHVKDRTTAPLKFASQASACLMNAHLLTSGVQKLSLPSLMLYMPPLEGIWMLGAVNTNSPMDGSKVKTLVPEPTLNTMQQLLPYMQ